MRPSKAIENGVYALYNSNKNFGNTFSLRTTNKFFDTKEIIIHDKGDKLIIRKPTLDYIGKTYNVCAHKTSSDIKVFYITSDNLVSGKTYYFHEDSTEDELIIELK